MFNFYSQISIHIVPQCNIECRIGLQYVYVHDWGISPFNPTSSVVSLSGVAGVAGATVSAVACGMVGGADGFNSSVSSAVW